MKTLTTQDWLILANAGISTEKQLREQLESNPEFVPNLVKGFTDRDVAAESQENILAFVAQVLCSRSRSNRLNWLLVAWPTLAVLIVVGFSGWAIYRDISYTPKVTAGVRIAESEGLQPFHPITKSDIRMDTVPSDSSSLHSITDAIGRYTTKYLPANSVLGEKQLSIGRLAPATLRGRIVIRLKVVSTNVFNGIPPPFKAGLTASPHERGAAALLLDDVLVLDLQNDGEGMSAVLAVSAADQSALASFAARSDFYLVGTKY